MPADLAATTQSPSTSRGRPAHINDLPVEILAMVFLCMTMPYCVIDMGRRVWTDAELPPDWMCAAAASKVCKRWYSIALATPRLWTFLYACSCRYLSLLPRALARSGNADLFLFVYSPNALGQAGTDRPRMLHPMQQAQWKPGLDAIVENLHRIVHLQASILQWQDSQIFLDILRTRATPRLRYFHFGLEFARNIAIPRDIFACDAPRLEYIHLSGVFPEQWGSPLFAAVRNMYLCHVPAGQANRVLRDRLPQPLPTIADLAQLFAASSLDTLCASHFAFQPANMPITSVRRRSLKHLEINLLPSVDAYRQLVSCVAFDAAVFVLLRTIPSRCAVDLFSHLHGHIDMHIFSTLPDDVEYSYIDGRPASDDAYDVGHWLVQACDSHGYTRVFETEKQDFRRARGLEIACATSFSIINRLHITAGQWPQVSDALSLVTLPCVSVLVLRYSAERALLGDDRQPRSIPYHKIEQIPGYPADLFNLRGAVLQLPALAELILHGTADLTTCLKFLPLIASVDAFQSISRHLSLDLAPRPPATRLINILPAEEDAWMTIDSISTGFTMERSIPEYTDYRFMATWDPGFWWKKRFQIMR